MICNVGRKSDNDIVKFRQSLGSSRMTNWESMTVCLMTMFSGQATDVLLSGIAKGIPEGGLIFSGTQGGVFETIRSANTRGAIDR